MKGTATTIQHNKDDQQREVASPHDLVKTVLFDANLGVENAEAQGYRWVGDYYGKLTPPEIIELIILDVKTKGYKIGRARWHVFSGIGQDNWGLYCPLPITQEDNQQKKKQWSIHL